MTKAIRAFLALEIPLRTWTSRVTRTTEVQQGMPLSHSEAGLCLGLLAAASMLLWPRSILVKGLRLNYKYLVKYR